VVRDVGNDLHAATVDKRGLQGSQAVKVWVRLRDTSRLAPWPVEDVFIDLEEARRRQDLMAMLGLAVN
jgi:hypothetical protein